MQSKTTRGLRHLLVSTGVIGLVLSVAAPAALANRPVDLPGNGNGTGNGAGQSDNSETGHTEVVLCHNGHVIIVDDDATLVGHKNHGDAELTEEAAENAQAGDPCDGETHEDEETAPVLVCRNDVVVLLTDGEAPLDGDVVIVDAEDGDRCDDGVGADRELVCRNGHVIEVDDDGILDTDVPAADDAVVGDDCGEGEIVEMVKVCHDGRVLEVAADAVDAHGDGELGEDAVVGGECGEEEPVIVTEPVTIDPVTVDPVEVEPVVVVTDPVVETPAAEPLPVVKPLPVVLVPADTVTKPVAPATPKVENQVLGSVTTRIPTAAVSAPTTGSITALAATGLDGTLALAAGGAVLLLAGLGLQVGAERRMRSAEVKA